MSMGVKEEFLRLLKEDEEFRLAAASLLGYIELIKRLDENEKRIDSTLAEIKKLREDFNREMHNLREDFNREVQKLREDFNREMHNLREEQIKMREEFNRLEHRFEVILGRMGRRWGVDLEKTMLGTFKEVLEKEGIEIGKVESFSYTDYDGSITGLKGRRVQVDILVKNGKLTLIEVKSFPEFEDVDHLRDVVGYVEKILKRSVDQVYLVAVNIDRETLNRAKELGFKVIYGNLVE
ncbi:hypothetical protein B9Q01_02820 [Candidatus Marsarchaeota G1 archaeon OSP_D]|uniref:Microtubule-binding protein n=5 Tax=Candidatus Marsarchaeota TaxID=1978152 RepID=A0A2R6AG33_9ARCH|nr:MAG: hypothetical protein B9Q01_02820 [Candidatus Marsarchaeota G1 archaeon OSP_D]PSN85335.1 MAG: hypothetical protein B9Q02_06685 [Candidatus Marsarchaeota G1 archaeon BE_D]PSO02275.1 MAG: hypothetical protein B9Q10_01500 [Candidatus Marsarchaeota G2 archaeon ECH_B_SAG-E12]